jgi:hypothetical protein
LAGIRNCLLRENGTLPNGEGSTIRTGSDSRCFRPEIISVSSEFLPDLLIEIAKIREARAFERRVKLQEIIHLEVYACGVPQVRAAHRST